MKRLKKTEARLIITFREIEPQGFQPKAVL